MKYFDAEEQMKSNNSTKMYIDMGKNTSKYKNTNKNSEYMGKSKRDLQIEKKKQNGSGKDDPQNEVTSCKRSQTDILNDVLMNIEVGNKVFLVGPAGSGKTTIAIKVAEMLKKDFYLTGAVHQKHELLGFTDATSKLVRTPFRDAFEYGGMFLFDEFDASSPNAITAFNAALANGYCAFPDGVLQAHKDFVAIAAANTYGTGATRQYVGRYQQDAASLDRFVFIEVEYDNELEYTLARDAYAEFGGSRYDGIVKDYLTFLHAVREALKTLSIPHIVSPRAAIFGARLLAKGMDKNRVADIVVFKGLDNEMVRSIKKMVL